MLAAAAVAATTLGPADTSAATCTCVLGCCGGGVRLPLAQLREQRSAGGCRRAALRACQLA
jgi:hypothetical protein